MRGAIAELGVYRLGEPLPPRAGAVFEWRAVAREGAGELVAKLATDATTRARLAVERARLARLADAAPDATPLLVDALAAPEGGLAALVFARAPGPSLEGVVLDEARALALAASIARLLRALEDEDLAPASLAPSAILYDPASGRHVLTGLGRVRPAAGQDPRARVVAWGELIATLLGTPRAPRGWLLGKLYDKDRKERARPEVVMLLRGALAGSPEAFERVHALAPAAPSLAKDLRAKARRGYQGTVTAPGGLAYHVITALASGTPGVARFAAACAQTDVLVALEVADAGLALSGGADAALTALRAARSRVEAEFERARSERAPLHLPLLRFRGAPLDPRLLALRSPEVRREETFAVYALADAAPLPQRPAPVELASFSAKVEDGRVKLAVERGAADSVLVVSAPAGQPLLGPEDGARVEGLEDALPEGRADRVYAAFPSAAGALGVPWFARLSAVPELESFVAEPGVGKVAFAWGVVPAGVRAVVVRTGATPPAAPHEGELAYWGLRRARVEVAADAGKTVHARAFLLLADGSFSRGVAAQAESWAPPEPVAALAADGSSGRVVRLTWAWPAERARIQGATLRRDPPFAEGARSLDPQGAPAFEDGAPPLGAMVRYEVATVSAGVEAKAEVSAIPWAELAAFAAEGAGEAVRLTWKLPEGSAADLIPRIVRRLERAPADLDDGDLVPVMPGTSEQLDGPLPAGTTAHYRAGLVFASGLQRSPGLPAQATALEKAGQLEALVVASKKRAVEVRWTEPPANVDDAVVYAGPEGKDPVAYDRAAFQAGRPVRIECAPGVLQRVRVVPRLRGREDPAGAVSGVSVAWDELESVTARPGPGQVELSWAGAPPNAEVVVKRRLDVKDAAWDELRVEPGATSLEDEPPKGKACVYKVVLRFRAGDVVVESEGVDRKEQARELPPELGTPLPKAKVAPGSITLVYFEPKARVNYSGVAIYESPRPPHEVQAAFKKLGREHHQVEDLPALGVELVEVAQKEKTAGAKVEHALFVRDGPRGGTLVLATRNGPIRRVVAILRVLRLPPGVLALRATVDEATGKPRLEWTPLKGGEAGIALARLELRRALADPDAEIPPRERERLEAPFAQPLSETQTSHLDSSADDGVTFAYSLVATFESAEGDRFEVTTPPAQIRGGRPGGRLLLSVAQAKGFFGFSRPAVIEITVRREGGQGPWPPFQVLRGLEGAKGEVVVASFDGGEQAPGTLKDEDLSAFTPGVSLVYSLKLVKYFDARRIEVGGASKVKLG